MRCLLSMILERLPIYPMFGRGLTRLQPAYVEDVAEAITRALQRTEKHPITFECGGPRVYSYEELLKTIAHEANLKPTLVQSHLPLGTCWLGSRKCFRTRRSPGTKWS